MFFCTSALAQKTHDTFVVAPVFQDNMVLQQNTNVSVWGKGIPGQAVVIKGSWGKTAKGTIGKDGNWKVRLQTPKAGGPYELTIQSGESSVRLKNILIGEVWLCSGQSNMEMPLEGWPPTDTIMNSAKEIEQAQYPNIRLLKVNRNFAAEPVTELNGIWEECTPATVRSFSAVAYFFGREIHKKLKVPVGLIQAAWGGTAVEPWISKEVLSQFNEYKTLLKGIDRSKDSLKILNAWLAELPIVELGNKPATERWKNLEFDDKEYAAKTYDDSKWYTIKLPTLWEQSAIGDFDGIVWLRKTIEIPKNWLNKPLTLFLGPIDDMDETYVNGILVGETLQEGYWRTDRIYKVPGSIITDTVLTIAVRVIDNQGGGGIWGDGKEPYLRCDDINETISLAIEWKCMPVAEYRSNKFYVYGKNEKTFAERPKLPVTISGYTATTLYNGMIYPLVPMTIRGVIWYQGESNISDPLMYQRTFPALIANWRRVFESGNIPFYFVQIAPYDYGENSKSQELRESQLLTMEKVPNTGMVVTLDIGNPKNIHPANKQDVGYRLALWALAKTYKQNVGPYSGPIFQSQKKKQNKLVLLFKFAESGLVLKETDGEHNFWIAGEDRVFKKAFVEVKGNTLLVWHPDILNPVAVRYAWSNTASATLFNKEGLPASSFRTDSW